MNTKAIDRLTIAALAVALTAGLACTKVDSNQVGVRVLNIPLVNRVERKAKLTGYHLFVPYAFTFYKLPRTNLTLEMMEESKELLRQMGSTMEGQSPAGQEQALNPQQTEQKLAQIRSDANEPGFFKNVIHERPSKDQSVRVKSADGNDAWVDIIVTYHVVTDDAWKVVEAFKMNNGLDEIDRVVESMVRGAVRSWLGGLDSKEILRAEDR